MHRLHLEMNENGGLREVVLRLSDRVAANTGKMGLVLDLNPVWRFFERLDTAGVAGSGWWLEWPFGPLGARVAGQLLGPGLGGALDFEYRSRFVQEVVDGVGGRERDPAYQPFLLRVVTDPRSTREEREGLLVAARETEILTVVNTHPVPRLVAGPGSELTSVATGTSGTLGGYLSDNAAGEHFAVTCGHVGTSGDFTSSGVTIGKVTVAKEPTPLPRGVRCHARCGSMTELDLALIDVGSPGANIATGVAGIVGNGDLVTMDGSTSGMQTYEVGGLVVEHEIGGSCWERLIQLHAPTGGLLPVSVHVAVAKVPRDGDSGSWVLNGTEWAGMVVASDMSLFGFAVASDSIIDSAQTHFGRDSDAVLTIPAPVTLSLQRCVFSYCRRNA